MTTTEIVERILALTELTKATGTKTTRTVNNLLQSLEGPQLMEVAVELKLRGWNRRSGLVEALSGQSAK